MFDQRDGATYTIHSGEPFPSPVGRGWWALYTRHQHERSVAEMLQAKGIEVFLPQYESMRQWKDRRMKILLPLFPGYVFAREGAPRLQVVSTPGIHMIVARGENFAVIPCAEIEALQTAVTKGHIEPHPYLHCGDWVEVVRGPMQGVQGMLVRKKGMYRLVLSVHMLAQSAAVEVAVEDVEPISVGKRPVATYRPDSGQAMGAAGRATMTRL